MLSNRKIIPAPQVLGLIREIMNNLGAPVNEKSLFSYEKQAFDCLLDTISGPDGTLDIDLNTL